MWTKHDRESPRGRVDFSARAHRRSYPLLRILAFVFWVATASDIAKAQYVGFIANSAEGTVSVFAVVTSTLASSGPTLVPPGNSDNLIVKVAVGKNPLRIAVTPRPTLNRAYVTNAGDNSLWVIDITKISQEATSHGSVTAQNVNANNVLSLSQPGGIAIVAVTQGSNKGKDFAFVANQGNNTVSIINTSDNTLFGTVALGTPGSSATIPEVAATPDGAQVFVTNDSGLWTIDATTVTAGNSAATSVPVSGLNGNATITLVGARGVSATQFSDIDNQLHTLVAVADAGIHSDGSGYIFILERIAGQSFATTPLPLNTAPPAAVPIGVNLLNVNQGTDTNAEVIDTTGVLWTVSGLRTGASVSISPFPLGDPTSGLPSPTSLAVTPDGTFVYVTGSLSGEGVTPILQLISLNAEFGQCFPGTDPCGNNTSVPAGGGATGLAFSKLDPNSPPVAWFIAPNSGGFGPPPAQLPVGGGMSLTGASMVGAGQSISTTLDFGNKDCTLFGTDITDTTCVNGASGTNVIGGNTTFPASGVFTVSITNDSTDSGGNPTSSTIQAQVLVGANCGLVVTPLSIIVGQTVQAVLSCTAPSNDQLSGTIQWGDGTSSTQGPVLATGTTAVSLTFSHRYVAPSAAYLVSGTITDNTAPGSVNTSPISVVVKAPSCSLAVSPNPSQVGKTVTAALTCQGAASDTFTGTVNWGDGSAVPPAASMTGNNGAFTLSLTHTYSSPSNPTYAVAATATDTALSPPVAATFTNSPVNETVASVKAAVCSFQVSPTVVGTGKSLTATLNCVGPAGDTINGQVTWGDGNATTASAPATNGTANLVFTHVYSTASKPKFAVSVTASDTSLTPPLAATISTTLPIQVTVVVPPACTFSAPSSGQTGVSVSASLNCTAAAGDSVSGTVNWGDGTAVSIVTATVPASGSVVLTFTHTYAAASGASSSFTVTGTVQDASGEVSGSVSPASVPVKIVLTPVVTPVSPPTFPIVPGQSVTVAVNFAGGKGDAGITFTSITCSVSPTTGNPPTCSVTPSTLTLDANGNGTVQVTVTTSGPGTAALASLGLPGDRRASLPVLPAMACAFLGLLLTGKGSKKRAPLPASFIFAVSLAMLTFGCGSTVQRSEVACTTCTTPNNYTITVTAKSQNPVMQATGVFTVTVQP